MAGWTAHVQWINVDIEGYRIPIKVASSRSGEGDLPEDFLSISCHTLEVELLVYTHTVTLQLPFGEDFDTRPLFIRGCNHLNRRPMDPW